MSWFVSIHINKPLASISTVATLKSDVEIAINVVSLVFMTFCALVMDFVIVYMLHTPLVYIQALRSPGF